MITRAYENEEKQCKSHEQNKENNPGILKASIFNEIEITARWGSFNLFKKKKVLSLFSAISLQSSFVKSVIKRNISKLFFGCNFNVNVITIFSLCRDINETYISNRLLKEFLLILNTFTDLIVLISETHWQIIKKYKIKDFRNINHLQKAQEP